jgi:hypothetical protein
MILNSYAVLDAFLSLLRLPLALFAVGLGVAAWRHWRGAAGPEDREDVENRAYLLSLLAALLVGLNLASWPLLYLLLQSYVPEWSGVMCVYGVTRVGTGSVGASRHLPALVAALQVLKPLVVFACGTWLVLHLLNRRTETGPLLGRVLLALVACGLLTAADAAAEVSYLVIPKKGEALAVGCCVGEFEGHTGDARTGLLERVGPNGLTAAYFGINLVMAGVTLGLSQRPRPVGRGVLLGLLAGAAVALAVGGVFLVEVVAPTVLHLPYHHCPYDLIPGAPEVLVGVGLGVWAAFAVGWACAAGWLARGPEVEPHLPDALGRLLFMAAACHLGSAAMAATELLLA